MTNSSPWRESELAKLSDQVFHHRGVVAVAGGAHDVWQRHLYIGFNLHPLKFLGTFALRPLVEVVACWLLTFVMELAVLKLVVELADTLWELTVLKLVVELADTDDSEVDDCNMGNWVNSSCWPKVWKWTKQGKTRGKVSKKNDNHGIIWFKTKCTIPSQTLLDPIMML